MFYTIQSSLSLDSLGCSFTIALVILVTLDFIFNPSWTVSERKGDFEAMSLSYTRLHRDCYRGGSLLKSSYPIINRRWFRILKILGRQRLRKGYHVGDVGFQRSSNRRSNSQEFKIGDDLLETNSSSLMKL